MAAIDSSRAFTTSGGFSRTGFGFSALVIAFKSWNDARLTRQALGSLTDRELDDIGLCRGDIEDVAARA